MKNINLSILTFLVLTSSCGYIKTGLEAPAEDKNVKKSYYKDGKLKAVIPVDDNNERHGGLIQYFNSGEKKTTINYEHGEKLKAIQYYRSGHKQMEMSYKDGVKHGQKIKYWTDGTIHSKLDYVEGHPKNNLEEFSKKGKKISNYPKFVVNQRDNLSLTGEYIIEVYFSENRGRGTYYEGSLTSGVFNEHLSTKLAEKNEKGIITFRPAPGTFVMKKLKVVGKFKTAMGNPYFVEKSINVAIDY